MSDYDNKDSFLGLLDVYGEYLTKQGKACLESIENLNKYSLKYA